MKAANFVNVLLSIALVILCIELHAERKARARILVGHYNSNCEADFIRTLCAEPESHAEAAPAPAAASVTVDSTGLAPGVTGFGGPVPVLVEVTNGVVAGVSPKLPNDETPGFFKRLDEAGLWKAWDGLPVEVAATARVDAVTSATYSSEAAIANVRAALASAVGSVVESAPQKDPNP